MYKKIFLGLCAVGVIAVGLVACGGGSGAGSNSGTATTINGIAVPPAPDAAANNATLAGVDSNGNGVRDDAERLVAGFSKKDTFESYALQISRLVQRLATESISSQSEYNEIKNQIFCLDSKRPKQEQEILSLQDIKSSVVNTRDRSINFTQNETKYSYGWLSLGATTCN